MIQSDGGLQSHGKRFTWYTFVSGHFNGHYLTVQRCIFRNCVSGKSDIGIGEAINLRRQPFVRINLHTPAVQFASDDLP